ncbi:MAG: hypothetical protein ACJAVK_003462 [Akkermansiaceae bacterium]|jgi:hypothetical protein
MPPLTPSRIRKFVFSLLFGLTGIGVGAEVEADKATFDTVVAPFLGNYCTTCHGEKKDKGDLRLHQMSFDLASSKDLETWQNVLEQLQLGEMPPKKRTNPLLT